MTGAEVYQWFYERLGIKAGHRDYFAAAMEPFAKRGLLPVLTGNPSDADWLIACDLANRAHEAEQAKTAIGWNNSEGSQRSGRHNYTLECLARVLMNPGALTALERRYSLIAQTAREDRHGEAMELLAGFMSGGAVERVPDVLTINGVAYRRG